MNRHFIDPDKMEILQERLDIQQNIWADAFQEFWDELFKPVSQFNQVELQYHYAELGRLAENLKNGGLALQTLKQQIAMYNAQSKNIEPV